MTTTHENETNATKAPSNPAGAPQENRRGKSQRPRRRTRSNMRFLARSIVLEETGPPRGMRMTLYIALAGVFCFIGWAIITPLTETARAPGHVIPVGTVLGIQHFEGGIVSQVLVKDGTIVEKGAVIVRLHQTHAAAELEENRSRISALSLQLERHRAFAEGRNPDYSKVDPKYKSLIDDNLAIHMLDTESQVLERDVIMHQIDQRRSELSVLQEQKISIKEQIEISKELTAMRGKLMKSGHISRVVYLRTKQELSVAQGELREILGNTAKANQAIAEAEGKLAEADAKRINEAAAAMAQIIAELEQLRQTAQRLEDRMARTDIRAPVRGIVKGLQVHSIGAVVSPGGVISEIVPIDEELVVESRISPMDIGHIKVGQEAKVVMTTYDFARFGSIQGTVREISATTFLAEDGSVYYKAIVKLDKSYVGDDPNRNPILPGMITEAAINTGQKTLMNYMLRPVYVALNRAFGER